MEPVDWIVVALAALVTAGALFSYWIATWLNDYDPPPPYVGEPMRIHLSALLLTLILVAEVLILWRVW